MTDTPKLLLFLKLFIGLLIIISGIIVVGIALNYYFQVPSDGYLYTLGAIYTVWAISMAIDMGSSSFWEFVFTVVLAMVLTLFDVSNAIMSRVISYKDRKSEI